MSFTIENIALYLGIATPFISLVYFIWTKVRQWIEYKKASKFLSNNIEGIWYSAELDFKHEDLRNAYVKIEIKRKRFGNKVIIKTLEQLQMPAEQVRFETAWRFSGKLLPDHTLMGEYSGLNDYSMGTGHGFLRFIGNGRAVGHWLGYSGKLHGHIMYGYWILSKDKDDLLATAQFVLSRFQYYDIKYLVEHQNSKLVQRDYTKKFED